MADRSDSAVERVEFATGDLAEAHEYLCSMYSDHTPVLSGDRERFRFRARAAGEGRYGVEFVSHSMEMRTSAEPEPAASPLLRAEAFRLLTTALVETFPIIEPSGAPDGRAGAAAVRRAAAFIEDNAHRGIGLTEIAAAAGTSPRSLQAAFRRHLDTTPVALLHEVRLRRAHADLLAAGPTTGATVAAIAARWGFTHHGRFAAEYRRRFGRPPPPRQALWS
ncbi:AraC-like DNA-binding protein [Actinomadura namibiensis]|uniref:AraC-like DNA-binding protein n=1 Tax=Actinomadura namibiensis TaxID=182080 RepID=A0A7W3LP01_ACTNM|nr:helix-turn-helix transcriptional regulator [Actinomadura namibiensis]MBA8951635.1 AraC-like DNA-binding protein [Actinomadura namibiensis]